MNLSEYILKTREERTTHIDLESGCHPVKNGKYKLFHALLNHLGIGDDVENRTVAKIQCCHLCCGNSRNEDGYCVNPRHAYFGTPTENQRDAQERSPSLRYRTEAERKMPSVIDLMPW